MKTRGFPMLRRAALRIVAAGGCAMLAAACSTSAAAEKGPAGAASAREATSAASGATAAEATSAARAADESGHPARFEKLEAVMRSFDAAVRAHVPAQVDQHDRWEGVYPAMADAAAALGASARTLAGHPPKNLEIPDRGRFATMAEALEKSAGALEEAAARGDADAVETARGEVATACRTCHERFRPGSPGVPDAFR